MKEATKIVRVHAAYTLNFDKRVKKASVKNIQLVNWDHNSDIRGGCVMLQFGKLTDDTFAVDFGHPFTVESAFALGECMSPCHMPGSGCCC